MAANYTFAVDPDYSAYSDWIEIFNSGTTDYDLTGHYLTDNFNDTTRWEFPSGTILSSGAFLVIWADAANNGLHTNFRLSSTGEKIGIFDANGNILDTISFGEQRPDVSMGRNPDGASNWVFFIEATLEATNSLANFDGIASSPLFSVPGGFFSSGQTIELSSINAGTTIRYSLDGSEPDETSTQYTTPINVSATTVIRALAFETNKLPSKVENRTYFINEANHEIAVISISSHPDNFFDPITGFYENYNEDWERPIGIELYEPTGKMGFSANGGVSLYGNVTRSAAQKSFTINFSSMYGQKELNYKLFDDVDRKKFGSFALRNGGNNWASSSNFNPGFFCDAIQQEIFQHQMDFDMMPYRPSAVYINGEYWGIMNIREKMNEEYIEAHYGFQEDSLDVIKLRKNTPNDLISGDSMHFYNMVEYMKANDMNQQVNFDYIKTQMDVPSFIAYQIAETYTGNFDWPDNNCKFWRPQTPDGKWKWMMFDMDFGFNGQAWGAGWAGKWHGYDRPILQDATNPSYNEWSTIVMRKLLENDEFRMDFAQTYSHHLNTTMHPNRVIDLIDAVKAENENEMVRHIAKWRLNGGIGSLTEWNNALDRMRTFAQLRPGVCMMHLVKEFDFWPAYMTISKDVSTGGTVTINGLPIQTHDFIGQYFIDDTLSIVANPYPGYEFIGWEFEDQITSLNEIIDFHADWKYLDDGSDQGTNWKESSFDDSGWASGIAEFGYGEGDENTVVSYGPDDQNVYVTTYFRKEFNITDASQHDSLHFRLLYDDGMIIYINGTQVVNENMPGTFDYRTLASNGTDNAYKVVNISAASLVNGSNIIAVEVHQSDTASSDLSFDLKMISSLNSPGITDSISELEFDFYFRGNTTLKANFIKLTDIYINEVCPMNLNHIQDEYAQFDDWIEIYNPSDEAIDIGGLYISDNLNQPGKWQIPTTNPSLTTVPANGYLILWADNEPLQGENHLGFSLDKGGEEIGIFDIDQDVVAIIDAYTYDSIPPNKSFGRFPDGHINLQTFDLATPDAANNDTIIVLPDNIEPGILTDMDILVYPNPTMDKVNIEFASGNSFSEKEVVLINITGKILKTYMLNDSLCVLSVEDCPKGLYFIVIKTENQIITKKIIKQ